MLAQELQNRTFDDVRKDSGESHIGHYLCGEGTHILYQRVGMHPTLGDQVRIQLRQHPNEFFLLGIAVLTFVIITGAVWLLTAASTPLFLILLSMLFLFLPGSQAAVQVMNYLTTNLLPVDSLAKLIFRGHSCGLHDLGRNSHAAAE